MRATTRELPTGATEDQAGGQAAVILGLREAAGAGDWLAFLAAEAKMWGAYHEGGVKLNPSALPPDVALAWHEAMRAMIERYGESGEEP